MVKSIFGELWMSAKKIEEKDRNENNQTNKKSFYKSFNFLRIG